MVYMVKAYDTDYDVESEWICDTLEAAEEWANALRFDYGASNAVITGMEV